MDRIGSLGLSFFFRQLITSFGATPGVVKQPAGPEEGDLNKEHKNLSLLSLFTSNRHQKHSRWPGLGIKLIIPRSITTAKGPSCAREWRAGGAGGAGVGLKAGNNTLGALFP